MLNKTELESFGMPISDRYFVDENGNSTSRTAYEYIRDHLGYRLELKSTNFKTTTSSIIFNTKIINRGFAMPQNERAVFFVLLNDQNEIIESKRTIYDWRSWEPDEMAVANSGGNNLVTYPIGSGSLTLDEIVIGGLPLGDQNSDWYKNPVHTNYFGYEHTVFGSFGISHLDNGQYKIGIVLPDTDTNLFNNSDYSVKFANQALYLDCQGITVLGSFNKGNSGDLDNDADGIPNNLDANPYNPIELASSGLSPEQHPCGIPGTLSINENEDLILEKSLFFNSNTGTLELKEKYENIKICDIQGKLISVLPNDRFSFDLNYLNSGIYFVHFTKDNVKVVEKIWKQ